MFTRYKGTGIPENYSGVRFREQAMQTEMKTHKPSPSYTSTRTSVSPMFRSAQLQKNQGGTEQASDWSEINPPSLDNEQERKMDYIEREDDCAFGESDCDNSYDLNYQEREGNLNLDCQECESTKECEQQKNENESKKAHKGADFGAELGGLLDKIFKSIQSEDFLLLAVIFLLLGGEKGASNSAILPLALLLLYS